MDFTLFNRELSWLSFNYRVLQEAADKSNPLYERIKFLAIYSSNLDEFFRVRVASLRSLLALKEKSRKELDFDPDTLLNDIFNTVNSQQEYFGQIFIEEIIPALKEEKIYLTNEAGLSPRQEEWILDYFRDSVQQYISPMLLIKNRIQPFLRNQHLYLAVKLRAKPKRENISGKKSRAQYALIEIPTSELPRFVELPSEDGEFPVMFLDDIIKFNLPYLFPGYEIESSYSIKLTRDAELYIDDEFSGNLLAKIKKGIAKRDTGVPSRFLYDSDMPESFLKFLKEALTLSKEDLFPGGRYHNFHDFFAFPNPGKPELENEKLETIRITALDESASFFDSISKQDYGLYYPYHTYDYVVRFLEEAAEDESVTSIKVTQYRVAKDSKVVKALIKAAKNGKDVLAFVELKARFDEELNIRWAEEMEKAGVKVYYSFPGLKVHAKIALITRNENNGSRQYAYLATGNFNEKTANIYTDLGMFTAKTEITDEVENVFKYLSRIGSDYKFKHLLVAQFNMRKKFNKLVDNEISAAKDGNPSGITLKMNSLEDGKMIRKLYEASNAGVKINLIIRGICKLVPGVKRQSENIKVISIVDRYLEHSRLYMFHNNGDQLIYAASADWMKRNLSRRIEVAFPIEDEQIKETINRIIALQLEDNTKARVIDKKDKNAYVQSEGMNKIRSQMEVYKYLKG
ncbi:MAG: polyphosphate kinase [Melioribacteraceae bacterium]|nr:MAG: polyphosphate kinase [Melioribacteraceae bacterium]